VVALTSGEPSAVAGYHDTRFVFDRRRETLWRELWRTSFSPLVAPEATVLELGAGYGHFINSVHCRRRVAVDQFPDLLRFLEPGVEGHVGSVEDLGFLPSGSVDFAFASNLFEHLTQPAFAATLAEVRRVLRPGGTLCIVQPNYRFAYREYFDDYTHVAVYSDRSLCDFLAAHGFEVVECRPRFLPLTIKSRLPIHPWLIRLYLHLPFRPLGKQMLVRARPV
jgi:SAM-dependent methyltransferase